MRGEVGGERRDGVIVYAYRGGGRDAAQKYKKIPGKLVSFHRGWLYRVHLLAVPNRIPDAITASDRPYFWENDISIATRAPGSHFSKLTRSWAVLACAMVSTEGVQQYPSAPIGFPQAAVVRSCELIRTILRVITSQTGIFLSDSVAFRLTISLNIFIFQWSVRDK